MPKLSKEYREALEATLRRDVCRAVFGIIGRCPTEALGTDIFSMKDVARRAGVATGTLYNHFGSKDGLVASVIAESFAEFHRSQMQIAESAVSAADKLRAMCEVLMNVPAEAHRVIYIMTIARQPMPAVYKELTQMRHNTKKALIRIMHQGREEGLFGEASAEEMASEFASLADAFIERRLHWYDKCNPKREAAWIVDFFLHGAAANRRR